ncbi:MAG: glutamine synthetase beta-grasp domain-containing protein [Bacteroidetes bacterium]|nr:glutamine synthetase beta-grasp domain-containing protein [Bacteroidota bacterium]
MGKIKLEYVWLDGYKPTQSLRSKTKIVSDSKFTGKVKDLDMWSFDGSSTEQASGGKSDCLLKPVFICPDPARVNAYIVMCEVLNADGTAHATNGRATIQDNDGDFWFGFEQEYFLWDIETDKPLGFPVNGYPAPQGPYYCSVGAKNAYGRDIVEEHLDICLEAGLNVEGINAEVAAGQWEFQIFAKNAKEAGDQIWVARYLLERTAEKYGVSINWHCKPLGATDWNGSGMHANFSNTALRTSGSKEVYDTICKAFAPVVKEHIAVYGADNHLRLTGKHETQTIDKFSYGVSDRGASIRIPIAVTENGWKGWLEDRRPNSAADPYKVAAVIIKTVKSAKLPTKAAAGKKLAKA